MADIEDSTHVDNTVLNAIEVKDNENLAEATGDKPVLRRLSSLTIDDEPVIPLPPDTMEDMDYEEQKMELRCTLCKSPFRRRAEHVYLAEGRNAYAVVKFFLKHFNARVSWECVDTHMKLHCDFRRLRSRGLKTLEMHQENVEIWKYRERDLVLTGLLLDIDEIRGIDCSRNPEMALKRANTMDKLYDRLLKLRQERDEAGSKALTVNIFEILHEIYESMPTKDSKDIILAKVKELRAKLSNSQ